MTVDAVDVSDLPQPDRRPAGFEDPLPVLADRLVQREGLGVCGDWLGASDVEGAFLSGRAMAGRILGSVGDRP